VRHVGVGELEDTLAEGKSILLFLARAGFTKNISFFIRLIGFKGFK
jgi:hypothetical protein